jgi:hypothetical protein
LRLQAVTTFIPPNKLFNPSITSRNALFSLTALGLLAAATGFRRSGGSIRRIAGPFFKPTSRNDGYQADGSAIGFVFERGTEAAGIRGAGLGQGNNTSRVCPPATIRPS